MILLALTDLCSALCIPMTLVDAFSPAWPFGFTVLYCKYVFIMHMSCTYLSPKLLSMELVIWSP